MIQYRRDLWQAIQVEGNAAEIGVAEGRYSLELLSWKDGNGRNLFDKVYLVDRWACNPDQFGDASMPQTWHENNYEEVVQRTRIHGIRPVLLRGDSHRMADLVDDQSLSFLYIDGDHSLEGVTRDLQAWFPKVKPGGLIALHDYENPDYGVKEALQAFAKDRFEILPIPEDKPQDAGAMFYNVNPL